MTSSPRFAREKKAPDFSRNLSEQLKDTFSESVLIILNTTKTNINLLQFTVKNVLFHSIIVILDQVSSKILQEMCFNIVSSQMLCFATQRDECWVLHEGSAESVLPEKQGKAERRDDFAWKRQVLSVSHQLMFCKRFTFPLSGLASSHILITAFVVFSIFIELVSPLFMMACRGFWDKTPFAQLACFCPADCPLIVSFV